MSLVGSTGNILLDRSTCMCHGLGEWWNARDKNLNLLLTWLSWDPQKDSCVGDALISGQLYQSINDQSSVINTRLSWRWWWSKSKSSFPLILIKTRFVLLFIHECFLDLSFLHWSFDHLLFLKKFDLCFARVLDILC